MWLKKETNGIIETLDTHQTSYPFKTNVSFYENM